MRKRITDYALTGGGIMNRAKLKGLLKERNKTYKDCADVLGIGESQFCKKINGYVDFWVNELIKLAVFLNLSKEEFFALIKR